MVGHNAGLTAEFRSGRLGHQAVQDEDGLALGLDGSGSQWCSTTNEVTVFRNICSHYHHDHHSVDYHHGLVARLPGLDKEQPSNFHPALRVRHMYLKSIVTLIITLITKSHDPVSGESQKSCSPGSKAFTTRRARAEPMFLFESSPT